jgi:hypothetical protein
MKIVLGKGGFFLLKKVFFKKKILNWGWSNQIKNYFIVFENN